VDVRRYDVLFSGELVPGVDRETAKARLAALFKTDVSGLGRLFSGETIVIKKGLDEATAHRYREAMKQAGAVCRVRPSIPASPAAPAGSLATATVLPPGSLLPQPPTVPPLEFDLAGLTIAPPGVQLIDHPAPKSVSLPDISGITLAAPGEVLVAPPAVAAAPLPDISAITLAPPGSEVLRENERPVAPPPPAAPALDLAPAPKQGR
jgi:hypothetical protein